MFLYDWSFSSSLKINCTLKKYLLKQSFWGLKWSILCSAIWGEKWLFVLLIRMDFIDHLFKFLVIGILKLLKYREIFVLTVWKTTCKKEKVYFQADLKLSELSYLKRVFIIIIVFSKTKNLDITVLAAVVVLTMLR